MISSFIQYYSIYQIPVQSIIARAKHPVYEYRLHINTRTTHHRIAVCGKAFSGRCSMIRRNHCLRPPAKKGFAVFQAIKPIQHPKEVSIVDETRGRSGDRNSSATRSASRMAPRGRNSGATRNALRRVPRGRNRNHGNKTGKRVRGPRSSYSAIDSRVHASSSVI